MFNDIIKYPLDMCKRFSLYLHPEFYPRVPCRTQQPWILDPDIDDQKIDRLFSEINPEGTQPGSPFHEMPCSWSQPTRVKIRRARHQPIGVRGLIIEIIEIFGFFGFFSKIELGGRGWLKNTPTGCGSIFC